MSRHQSYLTYKAICFAECASVGRNKSDEHLRLERQSCDIRGWPHGNASVLR